MLEIIKNLGKPEKEQWERCLYRGPKPCGQVKRLAQEELKTIKKPYSPWRQHLDSFVRQGVDRVRGRCYAVEQLRKSEKFERLPCRKLQVKIIQRLKRK